MMRGMNTLATPSSAHPQVTVFGIANCDTVKKTRRWLTEHGISYAFHDFKKLGVSAQQLSGWIAAVGWEPLLNRKGTTWRQLDDASRAAVVDASTASALMLAHSSVIKRPVVVWPSGQVTVGFDESRWQGLIR